MGEAIGLQLALDHPDDIASLVLIGSGARLRVHPATLAALEAFVAGQVSDLGANLGRLDGRPFDYLGGSAEGEVNGERREALRQ